MFSKMPATFSACARQTYDVLPLEIARVHARDVRFVGVCSLNCTHACTRRSFYWRVRLELHTRDVHFVGVCSLNCTRASTRTYYARVQSSVHEKNTHALTVCTNCTRAFRHVHDSQDLPYAVHSSRFHVFHYCTCHIGSGKGGARGLKPPLFLVSLHRIVILSIQMCLENLNSPPSSE